MEKTTWKDRLVKVITDVITRINTLISAIYASIIKYFPSNHESSPEQIQKNAEAHYQSELKALCYLQATLLQDTISVILYNLRLMANPKYNIALTEPESSQSKVQDLIDFLEQKERLLKETIPTQEINQSTVEIFQKVRDLHPHLKKIRSELPKNSPELKNFVKLVKVFIINYKKQAGIHNSPSSHPRLIMFQMNERKVRENLLTVNNGS